jgi:hypothetical protein
MHFRSRCWLFHLLWVDSFYVRMVEKNLGCAMNHQQHCYSRMTYYSPLKKYIVRFNPATWKHKKEKKEYNFLMLIVLEAKRPSSTLKTWKQRLFLQYTFCWYVQLETYSAIDAPWQAIYTLTVPMPKHQKDRHTHKHRKLRRSLAEFREHKHKSECKTKWLHRPTSFLLPF